ncbi:MAG: hypothetical protein ACRCXB_22740 [Aeromonadaceae bacterium]
MFLGGNELSLESNIADLVTATNKLTNTVSGKITEINNTVANKLKEVDAAVSKVASDIRTTIRGEMKKTIYVDQLLGSDDNDGKSKAKALKTLSKATTLHNYAGILEIILVGDYEFTDEDSLVYIYNMNLLLRAYDVNEPVRIKFQTSYVEAYPDQYFMKSFQVYHSAVIECYSIIFELPPVPNDHGPGKTYPHGASVFRSNNSSLVACDLTVRCYKCKVEVSEPERSEWHFIGNPSGHTSFIASNFEIPAEWRDRNKMFHLGRLSDTAFSIRNCSHKSSMSSDDSVFNDGRVK